MQSSKYVVESNRIVELEMTLDEYHEKAEYYRRRETEKKAVQALLGICSGLIADDKLNLQEFEFLGHWLLEHREILTEWPGSFLVKKMNEILEDGIVSENELEHLKNVLVDLVGGNFREDGYTRNLTTTLPLNHDAEIMFPEKSFCFTGKFIYGPRSKCEQRVTELGGSALSSVVLKLDYLVIGDIGSDAWINSSYGRKIQKAVDMREDGHPILIVSEKMWLSL
jgi:NAD-dependent DNA ligase